MTLAPDHPSVAPAVDTDDADASQSIRDLLTRRINTAPHPSRLINQIALADWRCNEATQALARLIGRSPKVLAVMRAELRKEFEIDPDSLVFTEPKPPDPPRKVETLTERALSLLVLPSVVINVNRFTALSVKGDPGCRLPYTPLEILQRVIAMRLLERLDHVASAYWNGLVLGSWLTRRERWVELQKTLFADRAFMAQQLEELSSCAMAMVQALIDAPTAEARDRAGGAWASVKVGQLMWPGTPAVVIPGALHLYREGEPSDAPQVIYLPGAVRPFYEAPSFFALQCALLDVNRSLFHDLWHCLPLRRREGAYRPADLSSATFVRGLEVMDDALEQGALAMLAGQWSNELGCAVKDYAAQVFSDQRPAPPPLNAALLLAHVQHARKQLVGGARLGLIRTQLLKWDGQRRGEEIVFASSAPDLALRTAEQQVKRYEKGLVALLAADDPGAQTPAYRAITSLLGKLSVHTSVMNTLLHNAQHRLLELAFWVERPDGAGTARRVSLFMQAQTEALRCEVQLLHRLKLIGTAHHDQVIEVVEQPLSARRTRSETQVLSIAVGCEPDAFYPLLNIWVITTAAALRVPARQRPVVLYAFGTEGGIKAFAGLDALTRSLKASLASPDGSVLWGAIERDKRSDLRAHAARKTLAVRYRAVKGKPALAALKQMLDSYHRLHTSTEGITRIFTEVKDAGLSRALLRGELERQLKIPVNNALGQALANVELLRQAASEAKKLPAWLAHATRAQRRDFLHVQRVHLSNAYAFERRLEDVLPDLETFARRALMARLSEDGISSQWDIDQPFIDLPDDVHGSFCANSPVCTVGDRSIRLTPSVTRTAFSLLQLVLHNLDPLAPWTKWRLHRARYLQSGWKQRLNADYLIGLASSLDIGGQYDALIHTVFYPRLDAHTLLSEGRIPALLNRALLTGVKHHLFAAIQRGLSAAAQSLFTTAMAARTPQDLLKAPYALQLHVVHLVGHTMLHDRYIAGIVLVHDKPSGLCVVYWPDAPHALVLTEYASLQQAHAELNRIGAMPEHAKALARQVAPGWAFEAMPHDPDTLGRPGQIFNVFDLSPSFFLFKGIWRGAGFVRSFNVKHLEPTPLADEIERHTLEQMTREPQHWLALVPTAHSNAQALLYHANVLELQRRTQGASHSGQALQAYRSRRLGEQSDATQRRLVAFFSPLYGIFNDFYELLLVARRYHRFGDAHDAVDVSFMTAFLAFELLSNFVPGPKKPGSAVARVARPRPSAVLGRIRRLRMTSRPGDSPLAPVARLKALERFNVKGVPDGAVALKGPGEQGVYVKNGEAFVADDTHHYPVYRRRNEQVFRLKNPQAPGQDELILHIHQPREWLLSADAPMAGPSSGRLNPWQARVPTPPDWRPPSVRAATQRRIYQSSAPATDWFDWKVQVPAEQMSAFTEFGTFHVRPHAQVFPYDAIYIGAWYDTATASGVGYYRLLNEGSNAPRSGIAFIGPDEPMVSRAYVDIERWTTTARGEQPIPVSRNALGDWQLHTRLFDRPLEHYVGAAFPTMTPHSQRMAARRLVELADTSYSVSTTHLLNIRATLDDWLTQSTVRPVQTDDWLRMLRITEREGGSISIGNESLAPGFTRVDFRAQGVDPALRFNGPGITARRNIAQPAAIRTVLEQHGFNVYEVEVRRAFHVVHEMVATHRFSNSGKVYYIVPKWVERASVQIKQRLTDGWLISAINAHPDSLTLIAVQRALQENRLVRIVAGIQWPVFQADPPSVYFVRV
ncbi:hypothetical protein H8S66_24670 [Pseudomonas lurida]|uniref:dermonecrotic toxin domain-containing protein n=1 Tax=Pseudomonas lurida TaxID=244566 RepID=UPI0016543806|nr:DUF6543 domain-containing protein [Pseudomonas lurida]MBC3926078.1 hypothetical protein [Pseudomonas lurida]